MKVDLFYAAVVKPALVLLAELPEIKLPASDKAAALITAIAGQEGAWKFRRQIGGPARGFWQFEKMGGAIELFQKTPKQLKALCDYLDIPFVLPDVFEAMAWNDTLACAMARLLLWQDPHALPEVGAKVAAWDYYIRNWRPGAPHPDAWGLNYDTAVTVVGATVGQGSLKLV